MASEEIILGIRSVKLNETMLLPELLSTITESRNCEKENRNRGNGDVPTPRSSESSRSEGSNRSEGAEPTGQAEFTAEQVEAVKR